MPRASSSVMISRISSASRTSPSSSRVPCHSVLSRSQTRHFTVVVAFSLTRILPVVRQARMPGIGAESVVSAARTSGIGADGVLGQDQLTDLVAALDDLHQLGIPVR